jgi:hypothetical protein
VDAEDLALAQELLLADEVESAFVDEDGGGATGRRPAFRLQLRHPRLVAGAAVVVAVASSLARALSF